MAEKETLGLYLTGHPIDQYEQELPRLIEQRLADLQPTRRGITTTVAGLVLSVRIQKGQRGSRAFVLLDDRTGRIEAGLLGDSYEQFKHLLIKDTVVVVEGEVSHDDYAGGLKISVRKVMSLAEARAARSRGLELRLDGAVTGGNFTQNLQRLLSAHKSAESTGCPVRVRYRGTSAEATLRLGESWRVQATDDLLKRLRQQYGHEAVEMLY
jgi:DNA polymerase-3 subunit alpha